MRFFALILAALLTSCGSAPPPPRPQQVQRDPTAERWYGEAVSELSGINREAKGLMSGGKADAASALILKGQPVSGRLLAVPRPTLAAAEAASDLDELYGQMLFSNRNYGWARLQFQKNLARWKYWRPQTPETLVRLQHAKSLIDACDRKISE